MILMENFFISNIDYSNLGVSDHEFIVWIEEDLGLWRTRQGRNFILLPNLDLVLQ